MVSYIVWLPKKSQKCAQPADSKSIKRPLQKKSRKGSKEVLTKKWRQDSESELEITPPPQNLKKSCQNAEDEALLPPTRGSKHSQLADSESELEITPPPQNLKMSCQDASEGTLTNKCHQSNQAPPPAQPSKRLWQEHTSESLNHVIDDVYGKQGMISDEDLVDRKAEMSNSELSNEELETVANTISAETPSFTLGLKTKKKQSIPVKALQSAHLHISYPSLTLSHHLCISNASDPLRDPTHLPYHVQSSPA
ncbi:uncharacterized protein BJ212DRAFT_1488855 [Suillus subaureus]|uniref:Uncharacterized protein n=1 Tax=Suillus subaureus TaxID=48587 RepID=A0A9P7DLA3_9AGAM|nr:uncharacterized protein BJ212DRAFT_1488855 [Suillus subaureus]KAG1797659.1 hypothetical protein BJ212DRAFT_1488855 [Suillus subaureus]